MALSAGAKLGPYVIERAIGAGGMGEVYRARDSRLDRTVAIKILAPDVAADPKARERFEREAKTISALEHLHICTLYDVGEAPDPQSPASNSAQPPASIRFLVMQYLEGETLAERLARAAQPKSDSGSRPPSVGSALGGPGVSRGPIPLDQVLRYAAQVADALDAAHRAGVVHRDLKPGNVMLTKSGTKLLDFGLAKLRLQPGIGTAAASVAGLTMAATRSVPVGGAQGGPLTAQGSFLGTLQYMSPEQLHGAEADARSDIFAFGAMLFEMLTGRRAFESKSSAGIIAAILDADPEPLADLADAKAALPGAARRSLDRVLRKCLAKNPDERWQSAADLADELKWIDQERLRGKGQDEEVASTPLTAAPKAEGRERWWIVATAAAMLAAVGLGGWVFLRPAPGQAEPIRFIVLPPDQHEFPSNGPGLLSISPDGRRLAFVARASGKQSQASGTLSLWVRPLGSLTAQQLPGTDDAVQPVWSADSRYLAFGSVMTEKKVKRIDVSGGPPMSLPYVAETGSRIAWSPQGLMIFTGTDGALYRIADSGGAPIRVTELDKPRHETAHAWPIFLPDGRRFIFLARSKDAPNNALYLASLDSPARTRLIDVLSSVEYTPGYLLYQREGTLMAQPFDEKQGRLTGDATPIVEGLLYNPVQGRGAFSVSANGVLVYRTGTAARSRLLTWFDATGKALGTVGAPGLYSWPRLSPDGRRIVVQLTGPEAKSDLWLIDLDRGVPSRFTFDPADDSSPVWSPDGARVVFCSNRKGVYDLYQRASGGATADEVLFESPENKCPTGFSPDGKLLLFNRMDKDGKIHMWVLPMTGDRKPVPVVSTAFNAGFGVFSPDGRWIAYDSDDSGGAQAQVYVEPYPSNGVKVRLSTTTGIEPAWSADGKNVFYSTLDYHLMAVDVTVAGGELRAGVPRDLFEWDGKRGVGVRNFGIDPSGQKFLIPVMSEDQAATPIVVVSNWTAGLRK